MKPYAKDNNVKELIEIINSKEEYIEIKSLYIGKNTVKIVSR